MSHEIFVKISLFLLYLFSHKSICEDVFSEELLIRNTHSGHAYFHFQFVTTWNIHQENAFEHYRLFPKSLGDILSVYNVRELHLSMTQGLWRHQHWGYPVADAPPGAELWVWFNNDTTGQWDVDERWRQLTHTLSGLFCASLNFMDARSTVTPRWSFRPAGLATGSETDLRYVKYAALPREIVCTENLTPWKKLLPCDSKAGLAHLFNAVKLYDTNYHSLGTHFRPVCRARDCSDTSLELTLSLSVVFNPSRDFTLLPNWSLKKLFGRSLINKCPFAESSRVYVELDPVLEMSLHPPPSNTRTVVRGGKRRDVAVYDIPDYANPATSLNIEVKFRERLPPEKREFPPPLTAHRFITGYGLLHGGISCHLRNDLATPLSIVYMDSIPWYIRVFYHTLTVTSGADRISPRSVYYRPGKDRVQPYLLELVITLPPRSLTTISYQFQRAFLKWTEYPPDANHGFYINSAVVGAVLPDVDAYRVPPHHTGHLSNMFDNTSTAERFLRLHTETLLVSLPTPDFSMPYNVICLTCTVIAIAFGSLHNLTTRELRAIDPNDKRGIVAKLKTFVGRWRKKADDKDLKGECRDESIVNDDVFNESTTHGSG